MSPYADAPIAELKADAAGVQLVLPVPAAELDAYALAETVIAVLMHTTVAGRFPPAYPTWVGGEVSPEADAEFFAMVSEQYRQYMTLRGRPCQCGGGRYGP